MTASTQEFRYSVYRAQLKGQKMAKLQEQVEYFSKKIELETVKLQQLNTQITVHEEDLIHKRVMLADKTKKRDEDPITIARKNKTLQMKLDGIRSKQNNIEAENKRLKSQINALRRERNLFNQIFSKLKGDLSEKKDDLIRVISESNFARQYIEKGQAELNEQQKQAYIEQKKFEKEFMVPRESTLKLQLPQQAPQNQLTKINTQQKDVLPSKVGTFRDIGTVKDFMTQIPPKPSHNISMVNGKQMHDTQDQLSNVPIKQLLSDRKEKIKQEEKQLQQLQVQVQDNENIFEALLVQTGCYTMDEVIKKFVDYEEENYILFRNVNQLDDEYETLQRQKKILLQGLNDLQQLPKDNKQDNKAVKMEAALREIQQAKLKKEHLQNKYNDQLEIWDSVKLQLPQMHAKLQAIYTNFGYECKQQMHEDINMTNATKYLSQMEFLTQNILQHHSQLQSQRQIEKRSAKMLEESNNSSAFVIAPVNEEFDKALQKLEEEFKVNIDKALEERRSVAKETENKDKFITSSEMRDQAEKDFKKYSTKKVLIARRGTFQTYQK